MSTTTQTTTPTPTPRTYSKGTKKFMKLFDSIKNIYQSKSQFLDTQNDLLYLQKDIGKKFYGVNQKKLNEKESLYNRKLVYDQREMKNKTSMYTILKYMFILLSIISLILLIIKPMGGGSVL